MDVETLKSILSRLEARIGKLETEIKQLRQSDKPIEKAVVVPLRLQTTEQKL